MNLPAGLTARPLTLDDVDDTIAMVNTCELVDSGELMWERADLLADASVEGFDPDADWVGVFEGDRIVAWAFLQGPRHVWIDVAPDARGRGVGTALRRWAVDRARARGNDRLGQTIDDRRIAITASIGFLVAGAAHRAENDVLRDLDLALREGKLRGPNRVTAWQPALTRVATRRYSLADEMRRAVDNSEFTLYYQPIVRLADGRLIGAEALLRWNHPSDGLVSPATFIPVLEETSLIVPVGCWAVHEAVRQMQSWRLLYGRNIIDWVSINVSARQFNDPSPPLSAFSEIYEGGFPLRQLMLEITETSLMHDPEAARGVLAELQKSGIRIAIDDFGTGYSSLAAFQHYRADAIKIDAGFVARIDSPDGSKLAAALLNIARIPGADIIAEGVETAAQRAFLHANGCHLGQGYLFASRGVCSAPMLRTGAVGGSAVKSKRIAVRAGPPPGTDSPAQLQEPALPLDAIGQPAPRMLAAVPKRDGA